MNDRDWGLQTLRDWYSQSLVYTTSVNFDQVVAHYDAVSPTFIVGLGGAARVSELSETRIRDAMGNLASLSGARLPWYGTFFDALKGERLTLRFDDVKDIAAATVSDVKGAAITGASLYLGWIALTAGALFLAGRLAK